MQYGFSLLLLDTQSLPQHLPILKLLLVIPRVRPPSPSPARLGEEHCYSLLPAQASLRISSRPGRAISPPRPPSLRCPSPAQLDPTSRRAYLAGRTAPSGGRHRHGHRHGPRAGPSAGSAWWAPRRGSASLTERGGNRLLCREGSGSSHPP